MLSTGAAWAADEYYKYRFDDVYGPSGIGGQWVISARSTDIDGVTERLTRGNRASTAIETEGNFVNSRDHIYSDNGRSTYLNNTIDWTIPVPIDYIFMVVPENKVTTHVDLTWADPHLNPGEAFTCDVRMGQDHYHTVKESLGPVAGKILTNRFRFDLTKTTNPTEYGTVRTYMTFHQNPNDIASQTINVPLIIANVADGMATVNPLEFRTILRGTTTTGAVGDIVAYDHFKWDVTRDKEFGGDNDWIFVPLQDENIDHWNIYYNLTTHIRNFCGIRYELQRYDGQNLDRVLYPKKWAMDLPSNVKDVLPDPELRLEGLSHIAPGLITTYEQNYNVITAAKNIFRIYPVDPNSESNTPRDLLLRHTTIHGVDLGEEVNTNYSVRGFRYLPADPDFLVNAACDLVAPKIEMPQQADGVMTGSVSSTNVTADAVSTVKIDAPIPTHMQYVSYDVVGLLPLHITFNLPKTNRFVTLKWDALLDQWKKTGDIADMFFNSFRLHMHANDGTDVDLSQFMKDRDIYNTNVKVFVDEEKGKECVTVSLIAMLVDSKKTTWDTLLADKTTTTDRKYLTIRDGNRNDRWDMTLYVSYIEQQNTPGPNPNPSSGGGGGCNAGWSLIAGAMAAAFAVLRNRKDGGER